MVTEEFSLKTNYLIDTKKLKGIINNEHISGALQMWRTDLEDTSYSYKGIMASPTQIENLFGHLGISSNDTTVIYDNNRLCEATRLWWILQNYNFKNTKMLQGGIET
jgi:thiosulfate/3-mercaptopyruvate sulfurtransferase